jgi:hypothetical protein
MTEKLNDQYFVEIVEYGSEKVIEKLGPKSEHMIEKVERGININLNHKKYFTRIVEE